MTKDEEIERDHQMMTLALHQIELLAEMADDGIEPERLKVHILKTKERLRLWLNDAPARRKRYEAVVCLYGMVEVYAAEHRKD